MLFTKTLTIHQEVLYLGLLSFVIILVVFGILGLSCLYHHSMESTTLALEAANRKISIFTEEFFREVTSTIQVLSNNDDIRKAGGSAESTNRALALYRAFAGANENIAYIYSGYEDGTLLINDYTPPEGYDPTVRPWYTAALDSKPEPSIGLPYQEARTEEWLLSQSRVLRDAGGDVAGVIAIDCSLESLIALMGAHHVFDSQRSYILDEEGTIIIHPDAARIGRALPDIQESVSGERGTFDHTVDQRRIWASYDTIDSTGWTVISTVDRWEVLSPILWRAGIYALIVLLLSLLLGILVSRIFGRRFAEPLARLGERIAAITAGQPPKENTYQHSNPEIAAIADNIERLTQRSLNKRATELQTIIESIREGLLVVNNEREVVYSNSRFRAMWQLGDDVVDSRDERLLLEAITDQVVDPEGFLERIRDLYISGRSATDTIHCRDGRVYERFSCPLFEGGQVVGRLWSFWDVTERRQNETMLERLATTDELTGLYNRRYFMRKIGDEIKRARRYGHIFSTIMLDIDHFKNVNDTYGHAAGDVVLEHLGAQFKDSVREVDVPARLGGEEFGILLPNTELHSAVRFAERLRQVIEDTAVREKGLAISITVSIGVAAYHRDLVSVDELLKEADVALYEAKSRGRNCIVAGNIQSGTG